jgi:hypothetical protein
MANASKCKALDVATDFEIITTCEETHVSKVNLEGAIIDSMIGKCELAVTTDTMYTTATDVSVHPYNYHVC